MGKYNNEVGIRYEKVKINDNTYILLPKDIVSGYSISDVFYSSKQFKIFKDVKDLSNQGVYLIDNVCTLDELKNRYIYFDAEDDFIRDFFFEEEKNNLILVQIKDGKLIKRKLPIDMLLESKTREIFQKVRDNTVVTLNMDSIDNLLNIGDITLLKKELETLRRKLLEFENVQKKNTSRVVVENGHVREIDVDKKIENDKKTTEKKIVRPVEDVSLKGLEKYIRERVFGHDEEIRHIAKTLIMNYTAENNEKREPILLVGPTGVGKTETMNAAAEYLGVPYVEVNTINLVPQGIKGESIEDFLYSLIVAANYDLELAQKGLIFFDEFDKLGSSNTDYKQSVKDILLKFIEGGKFTLDKATGDYLFTTKFLNIVFAGRFKEAFSKNRTLGFGTDVPPEKMDLTSLLSDKEYYGKELITRIKHIYLYQELTRETKKRILLYSKLSEYLQKKLRYERQFGVQLEATDSYIDAILMKLDKNNQSIRELNNLIAGSLEELEYELLSSDYRDKKVILTSDIIEDGRSFKIV